MWCVVCRVSCVVFVFVFVFVCRVSCVVFVFVFVFVPSFASLV